MRLTSTRTENGEEEGEGRDRDCGRNAQTPHDPADDQAGGNSDDETDCREGGCLPRDGRTYLRSVETEGLEEGKVPLVAPVEFP
jgi:hypothetical protein